MTGNEIKYMKEFWQMYNQSSTKSFNCADEPESIRLYRENLKIDSKRGYNLRRHMILSNGNTDDFPITIHGTIQNTQYFDSNTSGYSILKSDNKQAYDVLIDKMLEYDEFITEILSTSAQLSQECEATLEPLINVTNFFIDNHNRLSKTGKFYKGAVGAYALFAIGSLANEYLKQQEINRKRDDNIRIAKQKRKEMATVKYNNVAKYFDMINQDIEKIFLLYKNELSKNICLSDEFIFEKVNQFKNSFLLYLKYCYLKEVFIYLLDLLDAWRNDFDDTSTPVPVFNHMSNMEIQKWPSMLGFNLHQFKWDNYVNDFLLDEDEQKCYPVSFFLFFIDPYLLKTYIGVELFDINTTEDGKGLITLFKEETENRLIKNDCNIQIISSSALSILEKNPYFQICKSISSSYTIYPVPFGKDDYPDIIITGIAFLIITPILWNFCGSWIYLIGIIYSYIAFSIIYKIEKELPFVKQYEKYQEQNYNSVKQYQSSNKIFDELKLYYNENE